VGNPPGATIVPTAVPGPAVTAIGPGPVQGRPVNEFLPNGVPSIVVLGAGETGTGGGWATVFPLSLGLVVFPLSSGLLVFCASAIVIVAVRPRTLRPISAMRFSAMFDL
jgi:CHASE2 domain-containing sensor protein